MTFVDFNDDYVAEDVETSLEDENIDWASDTFPTATITNNSIAINSPNLSAGPPFYQAVSDAVSYSEGDVILVKLTLTDAGSSDLPLIVFDSSNQARSQWGIGWYSFRVNDTDSDTVKMRNTPGEDAIYTAVIEVYKII